MKHLTVSAPIFAVLLAGALAVSGVGWWTVLGSLFLAAPAFVLVCYLICTKVYPCDAEARQKGLERVSE